MTWKIGLSPRMNFSLQIQEGNLDKCIFQDKHSLKFGLIYELSCAPSSMTWKIGLLTGIKGHAGTVWPSMFTLAKGAEAGFDVI